MEAKEMAKLCNGGCWASRDEMPKSLRSFYPKRPLWLGKGYSCSNVVGLRSGKGVCDIRVRDRLLPIRCPLTIDEYNKLPSISVERAFEMLMEGV